MRQGCLDLNINYSMLFMTDYSFSAKTRSDFSLHILLHRLRKMGLHRSTLHMKRSCTKLAGHKK